MSYKTLSLKEYTKVCTGSTLGILLVRSNFNTVNIAW